MKDYIEEKEISEIIVESLEGEFLTNNISKISFLFVAFLIIAGGYATQIFSCSTQRYLSNDIYGKHIIGFGLIFMFIMLEGGWNFDKEDRDKYPVDWSNGNCFDSFIYAGILYFIFLLSSKMRISWNIAFFSLLFILYITNTQRLYHFNRNQLNKDTNQSILEAEKVILYSLPIVLIVGVIDYFIYKKNQLGKEFQFYLFFLGNAKCRHE
jgi:hypothetical protein